MPGPHDHDVSFRSGDFGLADPRFFVPVRDVSRQVIGKGRVRSDGTFEATITDPKMIELLTQDSLRGVSVAERDLRNPVFTIEETEHQRDRRVDAWNHACHLVAPFVSEHGLIETRMETVPESSPNIVSTVSAVEQHVELIIRVADWLLED